MLKKPYIILLLFSIGCAAPQQKVQRRYFWPPLPDTPKIEFLAAYRSVEDFPRTSRLSFLESVTGTETAIEMKKPWGITSDGEGRVYVVDTNSKAVLLFDLKKHTVDYLGKDSYHGLFQVPIGIALDASGNIYVSDSKRNRVYSFTKDEKPRITIGDDITLDWPCGIAVDNSLKRLYVVNGKSHNIAVFDLDGSSLFSIGKRGSSDGEFNYPTDVAIDSNSNIVVADSLNARVQVFDRDGNFIRKFGQRGDRAADFQIIKGIAVSRDDDIYVVDAKTDRIIVFDKKGEPLTSIGGTLSISESKRLTPGGFMIPQDIYIDKNDTIYVVDSLNKRFQIFQILNEKWLKEHPIE